MIERFFARWFALVMAVLCVPPLLAVAFELAYAEHRALLTGDPAALELRVIEATRLAQSLGPYSRFGWQHPGPLHFYLLAPLYALSGGASLALYVAQGLLNAIALAALLWFGGRAAPAPWHRFALAAAVALWSLWLVDAHLPVGWTEIWNPVSTLLPCALLLLGASLVAAGDARWLAPACALHALVVQSHVGYAPLATAALAAGGVLLWLRHRRAPVAGLARALAASCALLVLLWLPALWDQIAGSGNLGRIAAFFTAERAAAPFGEAFAMALVRMQAFLLPLPAPELGAAPARWLAAGLCLAQLALLALGCARGRAVGRAACTVLLCALPAALWAATRVDDVRLGYLVHWLSVLGAFGWIAIGWALLPERGGARRAAVLAMCVALVSAGWQLASIAREQRLFARHGLTDAKIAARLLGDVQSELARRPHAPLRIGTHDAWGVAGGLILQLVKTGQRPRVQDEWRFMFGSAVDYTAGRKGALILAGDQPPGSAKQVEAGRYDLYVDEDADSAKLARLRLVGARGARGDPAIACDGRAPAEGTPWDDAQAVVLDAGAELTLALPDAPLHGLRVLADGNDTYAIEGSYDGDRFVPLGALPSRPRWGLAARDFLFRRGELFRFVRLRPGKGDGHYSVAEVSGLLAPGYLLEPGTPAAQSLLAAGFAPPEHTATSRGAWVVGKSAALALALPGGKPAELRLVLRAYAGLEQRQRVRIGIAGRTLGSFELGPSLGTYWVHVPRELAAPQVHVTLELDDARAPADRGESDDARPLSAWLERVAVISGR